MSSEPTDSFKHFHIKSVIFDTKLKREDKQFNLLKTYKESSKKLPMIININLNSKQGRNKMVKKDSFNPISIRPFNVVNTDSSIPIKKYSQLNLAIPLNSFNSLKEKETIAATNETFKTNDTYYSNNYHKNNTIDNIPTTGTSKKFMSQSRLDKIIISEVMVRKYENFANSNKNKSVKIVNKTFKINNININETDSNKKNKNILNDGYVNQTINKIKDKIKFIKGVYDFAYPKVMVEKIKMIIKAQSKGKDIKDAKIKVKEGSESNSGSSNYSDNKNGKKVLYNNLLFAKAKQLANILKKEKDKEIKINSNNFINKNNNVNNNKFFLYCSK